MANVKITGLPAASAAALTQVLEIVNDPSGTPTSQKVTLTQIKALLDTIYAQLAIGIFSEGADGYVRIDGQITGGGLGKLFIGGDGTGNMEIRSNNEFGGDATRIVIPGNGDITIMDDSANSIAIIDGSRVEIASTQPLKISNGGGMTDTFTGTFLVLTALPSTFKTVTVINGFIVSVA